MRYDKKYNKFTADRLFEWEMDEWVIDRNGNLMLKQELGDGKKADIAVDNTAASVDDIE